MGWIPPDRYKGDTARFIDADTFIERGETVLPIVKKQLAATRAQLAATNTLAAETATALKQAQTAIADMEERHTVATQKAVEAARRELKTQLAAASEAGDHAAVAEITEQMTDLASAEKKAEKKDPPVEEKPFVPPPEMLEWQAENEWFGKNKRRTALFLACAQDLRDGGDSRQGRAFFNAALVEMDKELGVSEPREDKTEGGRHEGGDGNRGGRGKSFAALPADAKAACRADARDRVGKGKRYETMKAWEDRYAELYFKE